MTLNRFATNCCYNPKHFSTLLGVSTSPPPTLMLLGEFENCEYTLIGMTPHFEDHKRIKQKMRLKYFVISKKT